MRREGPQDVAAIRAVNSAAFGRSDEADLVDRLRANGAVLASFVAEDGHQVVGHVLFSRILIDTTSDSVPSVALAPLAVLPSHQRRGIGTDLVRLGLESLRDRGERSVLVLGDPDYYQRFGFSVATARELMTPFPPDAFMGLELVVNGLAGVRGTVKYPAAFGL